MGKIVNEMKSIAFSTAATIAIIKTSKLILERRCKRLKTKGKSKKCRPRTTSSTDSTPRPYRNDYSNSQWWRLIHHPLVGDITSTYGKQFRRRFRVPYPLFLDLLVKAKELGFKDRPCSAANIYGIPLELQILGVLRVLGRGTCFDGIEELTGGSAEAHRVFFHKFCSKFVEKYFNEFVYLPRTEEEKTAWATDYIRMGLPGAVGSTDCVHIKWERCPQGIQNLCTGKEGYPTLAFQGTVNHKMRFMSFTRGYYLFHS